MTRSAYTAAVIAVVILTFCLASVAWAVPGSLHYQGYLTDAAGSPIDGNVTVTFSIYTTDAGGTYLWTDTFAVMVDLGLFSVELGGPLSPFPPGLFDTALWLGVAVDPDPEMLPRRPLTTVAFSFKTDDAMSLQGQGPAAFDQSAQVSDNTADLAQEIADRIADVDAEEAARLAAGYLTAEIDPHAVLADGTRAMSGVLDMGGNSITNLANASLAFVDGTQISSADVGQWNAAYDWGDHGTQGYLASGDAASGDLSGSYPHPQVVNDSHTHDARYRTEAESDGRFVNVSGDTMAGSLFVFGTNQKLVSRATVTDEATGNVHKLIVQDSSSIPVFMADSEGDVTAASFAGDGSSLPGIVPADDTVTSAKIVNGAIVNADISPSAAISSSKIADGSGSGLDADQLDGQHGSSFLRSNASDTFMAGTLTISSGAFLDVNGTMNAETVRVGQDSGGDSDYLYFDASAEHLAWQDNMRRFYLSDDLTVSGTLSKSAGAFLIDHPLDPANKYLSHSFVESPDMKNVYDGVAVLDAAGDAVVGLPDWFEALNHAFRYQLTAIGNPGPDLYIAEEITGNRFRIAGGAAGMKVSWQVTGIRWDAYANAHRIVVEQDKPGEEQGTYLFPEGFGQPELAATHAREEARQDRNAAPAK